MDGGFITFDVPGGGASAALQPASPLIVTNGVATTTASANAIGGSYFITAGANGVVNGAYFNLTNLPIMYSLSTDIVGPGSVAEYPSGLIYDSSTVVTLTATPAVSSSFTGWSANCAVVGALDRHHDG